MKSNYRGTLMRLGNSSRTVWSTNNVISAVENLAGKSDVDSEIPIMSAQDAVEIATKPHRYSDDQIIDAWYCLMILSEDFVQSGSLYNKDMIFTIGRNVIINDPKPFDVWAAANRLKMGREARTDKYRLDQLIKLLKIVEEKNTYLGIEVGESKSFEDNRGLIL